MALIERNSIATPVTLKPYFENDEAMKAVGGVGYLAQLTGSGAGLIGARDFARQIYDLALLRELVDVGRTMVEGALDTSESVDPQAQRSEEHTSELQSLMRISYAVFCLKKQKHYTYKNTQRHKHRKHITSRPNDNKHK